MAPPRRFRIYLAGPINGCNPEQIHGWRKEIRQRWARDFAFVDPADDLVSVASSSSQLVEKDLHAIEDADGLLVNMWRESIGTAIGIVHASSRGRVVVAADPNRLNNRILTYYTDAVVRTPDAAARVLRGLLRTQASLSVLKHGGRTEAFDRRKLVDSIRAACRHAGCNDIVVPPLVLLRMTDLLGIRRKEVTTTAIGKLVIQALRELEQDPVHQAAVSGIRAAWSRHFESKRAALKWKPTAGARRAGPVKGRDGEPLQVPIRSPKSHATIWGKSVKRLGDIPSPRARAVFEQICGVEGVASITLTRFGRGSIPRVGCAVLHRSTAPFVIEGKVFDRGPKGDMQTFQIRVHDGSRKAEIQALAEARLVEAGLLIER